MIRIERAPRVLDVEIVFAEDAPRHVRDPLQPGARDRALGRGFRQIAQPRQLFLDLLPNVVRQVQRRELLRQLVLAALRTLAQLGLDRFHLLAQDVLPLGVADLLLHRALDVVGGLEHLAAPRQQRDHHADALHRIERGQHGVFLRRLGRHVMGEHIGEGARIADLVERAADFRRHRGQEGKDVAREPPRFDFGAGRFRRLDQFHARPRDRLAFVHLLDAHAAEHRHDHAAVRRDHLESRQRGDLVDAEVALVVAERNRHATLVGPRGRPRPRSPFGVGLQASDGARQQHRVFEDEYGELFGQVFQKSSPPLCNVRPANLVSNEARFAKLFRLSKGRTRPSS